MYQSDNICQIATFEVIETIRGEPAAEETRARLRQRFMKKKSDSF